MLGIRFEIRREGPDGGDVEAIYLATRRAGDAGAKLSAAKKRYHEEVLEAGKAYKRVAQLAQMAEALKPEDPNYNDKLCQVGNEQDAAAMRALEHDQAAQEAADEMVLASLRMNYGEQAEAIFDKLTDAEVRAAVSTIETGEMPADFFRSRGTPPSASTTKPPGASPEGSSSKPDLPAAISSPAA